MVLAVGLAAGLAAGTIIPFVPGDSGLGTVEVLTGCSQHNKVDEDRYVGVLNNRLYRWANQKPIIGCSDVVDCFSQGAQDTDAIVHKYVEHFVAYSP